MIQNYGEKIECQGDRWILPPSLTHDNLSSEWERLRQKMPKTGRWSLDAHRLQEIDSATLSFFLECLRTANRNQVDFEITSLNQKIKALLHVYGVAHLFDKIMKDN